MTNGPIGLTPFIVALHLVGIWYWMFALAGVVGALVWPRRWQSKAIAAALMAFAFAWIPVRSGLKAYEKSKRLAVSMALFEASCKSSGEKISRTVDNVEGISILKRRPADNNYDSQFDLNDPYGNDATGDRYIITFLKGGDAVPRGTVVPTGYDYVVAADSLDGERHQYSGHIEEPWQTDKHWLKGYTRFVLDKSKAPDALPRYGISYEDISTKEMRDHWIAGSSLKIIDLKTNETIAERIGYMIDAQQGDGSGGRGPWYFAADFACPQFSPNRHGAYFQVGQAARFSEKVLNTTKGEIK